MQLKNKVALVTGGTSGIGLAVAKLFVAEGARVVVASHQPTGAEIAATVSVDCLFVQTDVRIEADVKNAIMQTIAAFGQLDILVNSAGVYINFQTDIASIPVADFEKIMDINFKGIFLTTKHALPELLKTKGNIVNIASSLGLVPEPTSAIYCASKAAVIMFSKATALQVADTGVRINSICPGPIDTPMLHDGFPEPADYDAYLQLNPMKRAGTAEEVAKLARYLASEDAAFVTGGVYSIDGGEALR